MNLELHILDIRDVEFNKKTTVNDGVLYINKQELQKLLYDERFSEVDIKLTSPGENCRVVQVFDVIEPRAKIGKHDDNFPGVLGEIKTAGEGHTQVLHGVSIVTIDYTSGTQGMLFDMAGVGVNLGMYSKLHNIVLLCQPAKGVALFDYQRALRIAGLKSSVYLAEAGLTLKPDHIEAYNLGPLALSCKGMENLPRVAYIYPVHLLQKGAGENEPIFYGDNTLKLLPTIVHPNEILDGAILRGFFARGATTYSIQNHPIIRELYKRHGKKLWFVGVVITVSTENMQHRRRSATIAAKLVKSVLAANGVVMTAMGGATNIDLVETCELCEELGVKTAVLIREESQDATANNTLLFNNQKIDAIVNAGPYDKIVRLPAVKRVIGGPVFFSGTKTAEEEINVPLRSLCGTADQFGASRLMAQET